MAALQEVYKCEICGNIVAVVHGGKGALFCCGSKMLLQAENTTDAAREKHVPAVTVGSGTISVCVGSAAHPMQNEHYIEWIELLVDGNSYRRFLQPGDAPEASFTVSGNNISVRAYCNLHGLWQAAS